MTTLWHYADDIVSITFDQSAVQAPTLLKTIKGLGYQIEEVEPSPGTSNHQDPTSLELPETAPAKLRKAFARARKDRRPVVVDFWTTWCKPCIKLKKTTLANQGVRKVLQRVEFLAIDLDEHPELGKEWGVVSVPDVLFLAPDGRVIDRLKTFEEPEPFQQRLEAAIVRLGAMDRNR